MYQRDNSTRFDGLNRKFGSTDEIRNPDETDRIRIRIK